MANHRKSTQEIATQKVVAHNILPQKRSSRKCAENVKYKSKTSTATLGGMTIQVTHRTPILSDDERNQRKSEIEQVLFNVFVKYAG
jgi:hypothetical protein